MKVCHFVFTSFKQPQNRSIHVVERTKTTAKYTNMRNVRAKMKNAVQRENEKRPHEAKMKHERTEEKR